MKTSFSKSSVERRRHLSPPLTSYTLRSLPSARVGAFPLAGSSLGSAGPSSLPPPVPHGRRSSAPAPDSSETGAPSPSSHGVAAGWLVGARVQRCAALRRAGRARSARVLGFAVGWPGRLSDNQVGDDTHAVDALDLKAGPAAAPRLRPRAALRSSCDLLLTCLLAAEVQF